MASEGERSSMTSEGESEAGVEVYTGVEKLEQAIEEIGRKIDEIMVGAQWQSDPDIKALLIEIRVHKNNQGGVMKKFNKYKEEFCELYGCKSVQVITSSDKGFEELKETIEGFLKEVDDMEKKVNLLMVKFRELGGSDWTTVTQDKNKDKPEFSTSVIHAKNQDEQEVLNMGLKGVSIQDDYYKKPESSGTSTDADLGPAAQEGYVDVGEKTSETSEVMSEFEEIKADEDMIKAMGLEGKMRVCALKEEGKILLTYYKDQDVETKGLLKWVKECEDPDQKWIEIKDQAADLGADICLMLADLMFRLSEREQVLGKFREFKSALQSLIEEKSSTVIEKLISAFEASEVEIREREEVKLTKNMAGSSTRKRIDTSEGKQNTEESQIDQILLQAFREVCRLDSLLNAPGLPDPKVVTPMKTDIKQYEKALKEIDKEVKKLENKSSSIFLLELANYFDYRRRVLKIKIKDHWKELKGSDD